MRDSSYPMLPGSLAELIQAVQLRMTTDPPPPDQRPLLTALLATLLRQLAQVDVPVSPPDLQEVRGQEHVKRALEVAAAGGHHLLLQGSPGAGKRFLAQTFPSLLPLCALPSPVRRPSPTRALAAFAGELLLAHGGVLILEDLAQFDLPQLHLLKQVVETRQFSPVESVTFPVHIQLLATMWPCPCGWYRDREHECRCSLEALRLYRQRVDPICDTCFAMQIDVTALSADRLSQTRPGESSAAVRDRVQEARERQRSRFTQSSQQVNADIASLEAMERSCVMDAPAERLMQAAYRQLPLSVRHRIRIRSVARTIADLAQAETIGANHVAEAIQYRLQFPS